MAILVGAIFGRLTVLRKSGKNKFGQTLWLCQCECGILKEASSGHLSQGLIKSCGCLRKPHGMTDTAFFNVWSGMLKRCRLKSRSDWHRYGGRGISTCTEWHSFLTFKRDMYDSYLAHRNSNKKTVLDRIDNEKGYSPENCRWVDAKVSAENRRSTRWIEFGGKRMTMSDWAMEIGVTATTIADRLKANWPLSRALTKKRKK